MDSVPEPDQVFRKARWKSALTCLAGAVVVIVGLWLFALPVEEYGRRTPPEPITKGLAVLTVVYAGWMSAVAFADTIEPSRLILNADGFRIEGPSSRPLTAWADVVEISVEEIKFRERLYYRETKGFLGEGRRRWLAGQYEESPGYIASAMNRRLKAYRACAEAGD